MNLTSKQSTQIKRILKAFKGKNESKVLEFLKNQEEPINVTSIYCKLRMEQSVVSNALGVLRKLNIVDANKRGRLVYYSLNKKNLVDLNNRVWEVLELVA